MFAPNNVPEIHHREKAFEKLYKELEETFQEKFNLDYEIIPITGSGTLAIEIVLNSLNIPIKHYFTEYEFGKRMEQLNHQEKGNEGIAFPLYETSISKYQDMPKRGKIKIVDAVSAFPYYQIPNDADIFITVNSKQIGCNPGLSFIGIKKEAIQYLKPEEYSYLSLRRYIEYKKIYQTPHTPAIGLMQETLEKLKSWNQDQFIETINSRRKKLERIISYNIGEGPVFTFECSPEIKEKFRLYGKKYAQIFLWSGTDDQYDYFIGEIQNEITKGGIL